MQTPKLFLKTDLTRVAGFSDFTFVVGEDVAADSPAADILGACHIH